MACRPGRTGGSVGKCASSNPGRIQIQVRHRCAQVFGTGRGHSAWYISAEIGVGLFLGSARAIQVASPALLLAYAIGSIAIFFIMRALGELLVYRPIAGSFASYAERFIGPWAGFFTGWSYWFMWVVTGMAEITAVAVYVNYWFPEVPHLIPALITLGILYGVNLIAVGVFGEFEFWFAIIKVITIIALILIGLVVILFGLGDLGQTANFSNLWTQGGFFPKGGFGVLLSLQIVAFACAFR